MLASLHRHLVSPGNEEEVVSVVSPSGQPLGGCVRSDLKRRKVFFRCTKVICRATDASFVSRGLKSFQDGG